MKKLILSAALLVSPVFAAQALACPGEKMEAKIETITVDQLASAKDKASVYDANGLETRQKYGVIPGAKLLSHYANFDMKELPAAKDAELVFYCGSEACTAAPSAAQKAFHAGYTRVKVLSAGIKGWTKAGKPTVPLAQAAQAPAAAAQPGA